MAGESDFLNWVAAQAKVTRIPVRRALDHPTITGVKLPAVNTSGHRGLVAVRITGPDGVKLAEFVGT